MPITDRYTPGGKRLYKCDGCGNLSPWKSGWSWYGSWRELDDGEPVIVHCPVCLPAPQLTNGE